MATRIEMLTDTIVHVILARGLVKMLGDQPSVLESLTQTRNELFAALQREIGRQERGNGNGGHSEV